MNTNVEEVQIKIQPKDMEIKDYRFNLVLNFFSCNQESSIGQVRLQMRSAPSNKDGQKITVVNWEETPKKYSFSTTDRPELKKLSDGSANLILTSDKSQKLQITKLDDHNTIIECEVQFLNKADMMIAQWVNLGHIGRRNPGDLFEIELRKQLTFGKLRPSDYMLNTIKYHHIGNRYIVTN